MPKPLFTTKHYKAIAKELKNICYNNNSISTMEFVIIFNRFCKFFTEDNPNFKEKDFKRIVYKS